MYSKLNLMQGHHTPPRESPQACSLLFNFKQVYWTLYIYKRVKLQNCATLKCLGEKGFEIKGG